MSTVRPIVSALVCAAALALATPALAEMVNFKANLSPSEEVPPTNSKGSGTVTATYDTGSKKLTWKGSYSGLTGPATAAHFHTGEKGKNGGVTVPIAPATSPLEGSATLNDQQASDLMAGKLYVNVHTAQNKGGEIRGQLTK
jgi:CHRD domain